MANYENGRFIENNRASTGGEIIIPWKQEDSRETLAIAQYPDHGRPVFFGSLLRNNELFLQLAKGLNKEGESDRINSKVKAEIESYLNDKKASPVVFTSTKSYLPDIRVTVVGNPFGDDSIRIYHYWGTFAQQPAFYQLAIAKKKDSYLIEKVFANAGYRKDTNWDAKKSTGRSTHGHSR